MAGDATITQDQVSRAAEAIIDSGTRPTAGAIRERVGKGSMATVLKFFQAWRDAQVKVAEAPVPPALQKGLLDFVTSAVESAKPYSAAEMEVAT
ncbi:MULTISPECIES: DNA-binding protein [unclassified Caballeronia]|uniref:DNA-binding protein n=1 Tax=unclassified Caballeronia TaxID=2646786 RepID=UPI002029A7E3|nr:MULTISPECIES: DNA-binding protein [unclassified Caballeronia]